MSGILGPTAKKQRLQYDRSNIQRAYQATKSGKSVYRAARDYSVPESTLRDRCLGVVAVDASLGHGTLFSKNEEELFMKHIGYMAGIGYGYTASVVKRMAMDYAKSLGKPIKAKESLSNNWFYGFIKRWPNLAVMKPQKLSIARAKSASKETLGNYYKELATILSVNNLRGKPENIYNVDETGVNCEHSPPKVVCDKNSTPQNITSNRSSTVTIIAGGNAVGNSIPPYYIFPGKRWNNDFLSGACPGAEGEMSKSGWSNSAIFQNYLTKHFTKYVKLTQDQSSTPTLILYDGHKSHISLILTDWAKTHNVLLFVLPPHSSHLTQPLDVAVFGPLKSMYSSECQTYMRKNPGANISKYQIAQLTATPYLKALSATNLISAFRRKGICPFDNKAISEAQIAPSVIYVQNETQNEILMETQNTNCISQTEMTSVPTSTGPSNSPSDFFQKKAIIKAVPKKSIRKFVPPFITGNLHKKSINDVLVSSKTKHISVNQPTACSGITGQMNKASTVSSLFNSVKPSTSGTCKTGAPISLLSEDYSENSDSESDINDEDKCCFCNKWQPDQLKDCLYISIVNWGKCDFCSHWTHLKTCSEVRVLRRDSVFRCPHCEHQ